MLVDKLETDEKDKEYIRNLIENKNFPALNDFLDTFGNNHITSALKKLPALFGGEEVFEKAEELIPDENVKHILDELRDIYVSVAEMTVILLLIWVLSIKLTITPDLS